MLQASGHTGRLAPSPTGWLHLGHARSFVLAWCHARARGGQILLRIEDLDQGRSRPEYRAGILTDLKWLGLDWDGPMSLQSGHASRFDAAAEQLLGRELAYPCVCSRNEIGALSAPHGEQEPRYSGTCRGKWNSLEAARRATGKHAGLRLIAPKEPVSICDELLGTCAFDLGASVGDFLIRRRDGVACYQLAVVLDDAHFGVDEIVRGQDLLPSAARQAWLQDLLGIARPRWWHVPLVVDSQGRRLAKRSGDLSLAALRAKGVDPRAIIGWVAASAGASAPARLWPRDWLMDFRLEALPRSACRLEQADLERLQQSLL